MSDRERYRAPPPPEPPPHRVRAADLYPRLRTHYDEPGLDVPFTPICGEFVQWVGRLADGGIIAMSNYRLHAQPRRRSGPGSSVPLRVIDALETRDLVHLIVLCKNGRQLTCSFGSGDECVEWWRRLTAALAPLTAVADTFAAAYAAWAKEQPPSSVHRALLKASNSPHRHWFGPELERLGFTSKGSWRVTAANADYKLCPSYPPLLVVPATICDEELDVVARFRAMRRLPAVVWRHRGTGAVIARSSQPEVGWLGWRNNEDERLLAAYVSACANDRPQTNSHKQVKLLIVDARSYASAVTNRARGGGCECSQYYPLADIQFMCMPNIHHVRRSFHQLRALAAEPPDHANWHSGVERTLWVSYVSGVGRAASVVCRAVLAGRPVLVHCSDGWDRTPQIVAAAQLLLDPHYRTLEGFRVLIEREWLDFGHKFADRCGHQFGPEEPNERSPIFLQWLDWVHQLLLQYPCSFEFNEAYLIKLGTHVHSCMFGTFLCNSVRERREARDTAHVWELLRDPPYRNHLYSPHNLEQVLYPDYNVRSMQVWTSMFGCDRDEQLDEYDEPRAPQDLPRPQYTNGLMTKTRSCDNLLNEGEKRMTQRRCSDPNIAMDVMKLSIVVNDCEARRECRSALTDSCVDELPVLAVAAPRGETPIESDEVDGLHPDHFENKPRDLASGSSSLERELCPPLGAPASPDANGLRPGDGDTPDEPPVFVCDTYTDVISMAEAAREAGRTRNISITWRSISESSNQSSSERGDSHECSPDNEPRYPQLNGIIDDAKLLDAELNGAGSSESEGEAPRRGSQLTLCPASPRHRLCCCAHAHNGSGRVAGAVRCVCGAGAGRGAPPDGLPPAPDPLQARLHQIILYQRRVVEQLSSELREAREALRQSSPAHPPASPAPAPPLVHEPKCGSAGSGGSAGSSSGSGSEVEVGEEARGLVWVPDAAAARCQHCQQPFWLARRRHHCRRCGGLFCGACATREPRAERLCRRCRAHR